MINNIDIVLYDLYDIDSIAGSFVIKILNNDSNKCFHKGVAVYNINILDNIDIENKVLVVIGIDLDMEEYKYLQRKCKELLYFNKNNSCKNLGNCQLVWDYFLDNISEIQSRPGFIDYIGNYSRYNMEKPGTENFIIGLKDKINSDIDEYFNILNRLFTLENIKWDNFEKKWRKSSILYPENFKLYNDIINDGVIINNLNKDSMLKLCKYGVSTNFEGYNTVCFNTNIELVDIDILKNMLISKYDILILYMYEFENNSWWVHIKRLNNDISMVEIGSKYKSMDILKNSVNIRWDRDIKELILNKKKIRM